MGLDTVELILAIEEAFQIHIADSEAGEVSTVGDLHNLISSKLRPQDSKRCLTSAAFYCTRRAIVETLYVQRRRISPSTPLNAILPRNTRRENWKRIQEVTKLKLPELQHTGWVQLAFFLSGIALSILPGLYLGAGFIGAAVLFIPGLVLGGFLIKLSPTLAVAFPNRNATVGDLARDVLAINHACLTEQIGAGNMNDLWVSLSRIIVIQTAVDPAKITPEATLAGCLGID